MFNYQRSWLKLILNNFSLGGVFVLKNLLNVFGDYGLVGRVGLSFLSCVLPDFTGLNDLGWVALCRSRTWHRALKRPRALSFFCVGCLGHIVLWQMTWYGPFDLIIVGLNLFTFRSWTWSRPSFRLTARLLCLCAVLDVRWARWGPHGTLGTCLSCPHFVLCNRQIFFYWRTWTGSFRLAAFSRLLLVPCRRTWCWPLWMPARRCFCPNSGIRWTLFQRGTWMRSLCRLADSLTCLICSAKNIVLWWLGNSTWFQIFHRLGICWFCRSSNICLTFGVRSVVLWCLGQSTWFQTFHRLATCCSRLSSSCWCFPLKLLRTWQGHVWGKMALLWFSRCGAARSDVLWLRGTWTGCYLLWNLTCCKFTSCGSRCTLSQWGTWVQPVRVF